MPYKIIETCTACGLCVPECPIDAIEVGDPIYIINDTCCDFEDCLAVCPVDAILPVEDGGVPALAGADTVRD
ncbi:MAG TPA: 4Fe-4S binding protein [Anaerolineales bacterium]|nr:4Fe-4S binding protein [Anaerolineales bacterium]